MKLAEVLKNLDDARTKLSLDTEISFVTDDSRKSAKDCLFVCIKGKSFDGHTAAEQVLSEGAAAVVTERDLGLPKQIIVGDTRAAYALICSAFFGDPCEKLNIIGVTGTNGKTTTCFVLHDMLEQLGKKCGLIGTIKNLVGGEELPSNLTTPDPFELHGLLRKMVDSGCRYCVMEASSQALEQKRTEGIRFRAAIFTNLTGDHLDYHETFENYVDAKRILFKNTDLAVINADDDSAEEMVKGVDCHIITFSTKKDSADYTAKNIQTKGAGTEYELVGEGVIGRVRFAIPGKFSVYNSMGAIVCLTELGVPFPSAVGSACAAKGVPGRIEVVPTDTNYSVIIDYAHTPDGLVNILEAVREITSGRIITVFGCGGDRDKKKRPLMGKIAVTYSDIVVVTSDNPRTEDPEAIIDDIISGIKKPRIPVYRISDRTSAIEKALKKAREGDAVVLAGKGHETYQVIGKEKIHYDEREIVAGILYP